MDFVREFPNWEGGHATSNHFAWVTGLQLDQFRTHISQGNLPALPKPIGRLGTKMLYAEADFHEWVAALPAWKEALPARRAAERAEAATRRKWLLDKQRDQALAQYAKPEQAPV